MTTKEELIALSKKIASEGGSLHQPGDTVEYDRDNPDSGVVVFKRADGTPYAWMNAEDYLKISENMLRGAK